MGGGALRSSPRTAKSPRVAGQGQRLVGGEGLSRAEACAKVCRLGMVCWVRRVIGMSLTVGLLVIVYEYFLNLWICCWLWFGRLKICENGVFEGNSWLCGGRNLSREDISISQEGI